MCVGVGCWCVGWWSIQCGAHVMVPFSSFPLCCQQCWHSQLYTIESAQLYTIESANTEREHHHVCPTLGARLLPPSATHWNETLHCQSDCVFRGKVENWSVRLSSEKSHFTTQQTNSSCRLTPIKWAGPTIHTFGYLWPIFFTKSLKICFKAILILGIGQKWLRGGILM